MNVILSKNIHDLLVDFIKTKAGIVYSKSVNGYINNFKDFVKNDIDFWIVDKSGQKVDFDNKLFSVVTFGDNYVVMTREELK